MILKSVTTVVDFSSTFNTIQPELLGEKMTVMQVEPPLVSWTVDYLPAGHNIFACSFGVVR
ncbi:hypothetical protein EXN66_Car020582 [Channa argus]|uniref:Uncharacterized protein n=1 Tax=Channa argus TaxID=215402 RepID=A0A6G1QQL9_CHAAH|nr:hypothetical protein EXN66_Car020582 [Channa argus]